MTHQRSDSAFLRRLHSGTLLADGAMGTMLGGGGADWIVPEQLNAKNPGRVAAVHAAYVAAGAQLVETNTFGGSPAKLSLAGLGGEARRLNRAAAEIARGAVPAEVLVAGSIGPTGQLLDPLGPLSVAEAEAGFALQAEELAAGGADVIVVETMGDLAEAGAAVRAARRATGLPVVCSMSFEPSLRTMMGVRPEEVLRLLDEGADVVGANCGQGPVVVERVVERLQSASPSTWLIAQPNAGTPRLAEGQTVYGAGPDDMAAFARRMRDRGVAIVGGCCGSTPAHIAAMAEALRRAE